MPTLKRVIPACDSSRDRARPGHEPELRHESMMDTAQGKTSSTHALKLTCRQYTVPMTPPFESARLRRLSIKWSTIDSLGCSVLSMYLRPSCISLSACLWASSSDSDDESASQAGNSKGPGGGSAGPTDNGAGVSRVAAEADLRGSTCAAGSLGAKGAGAGSARLLLPWADGAGSAPVFQPWPPGGGAATAHWAACSHGMPPWTSANALQGPSANG